MTFLDSAYKNLCIWCNKWFFLPSIRAISLDCNWHFTFLWKLKVVTENLQTTCIKFCRYELVEFLDVLKSSFEAFSGLRSGNKTDNWSPPRSMLYTVVTKYAGASSFKRHQLLSYRNFNLAFEFSLNNTFGTNKQNSHFTFLVRLRSSEKAYSSSHVLVSRLSACSARLPLDGLSWSFMLEIYMNFCQESPVLVQIEQKYRALYTYMDI